MNKKMIIRDIIIVFFSVILAIVIKKTALLPGLLLAARKFNFFGSFLAGMFFVSIFTFVPATAALTELVQNSSPLWVALFGAGGALLGDFLIFRFIRDSLSENLISLIKRSRGERFLARFNSRPFGWLGPLLGAVIIASPFPDELGIALMGFSRTKNSFFIPVAFTLNFIGIYIIVFIAKFVI